MTKIWQDYLSQTGQNSRVKAESDSLLELPDDHWSWGQLGAKNRAKMQAYRAFELDLWGYFLAEPNNFASNPDISKIVQFFPDDQEKGTQVFYMLRSFADAITEEQTSTMLAAAMKSQTVIVKQEQLDFPQGINKKESVVAPSKGVSNSEQFKIRMEKFKEKLKSVPVFTRCYDTAVVTAWVDSIRNVFSSALASSWFENDIEGIEFVHERVDAACLEWIRSLSPPATALQLIETIRISHWPKRDIEDARDALERLRLTTYGLDRSAVYSFHQTFQSLLPRCKYTDNLALRRVYQVAVGKDFWSELLTNDVIGKDITYEMDSYYSVAESIWTNGWRPLPRITPTVHRNSSPEKPKQVSLLTVPIQKVSLMVSKIYLHAVSL